MDEKKIRELYAQSEIDSVYQTLNSSSKGLSSEEAEKRLEKYGLNEIKRPPKQSQWQTFIKNFTTLMAILLWISGFIAIVSGTMELGIAIWLVNIINGTFSFW